MAGKNSKKNNTVSKKKARKNTRKNKREKRERMTNRITGKMAKYSPISMYAKLISDPCEGPLVRAVGGDSGANIIERTRYTHTFPMTAGNYAGYMAWFPSFNAAGGATINTPGNLYYYETTAALSAIRPANTLADPMGTAAATSGIFLPDPASGLITGTSPFSRARTIAACMQLMNIGSISSTQGMVCTVVNINLSTFNAASGTAGDFQPPSVTEMLAYARKRERLSLDGHEVIWGPNEGDSVLRTNGAEDNGTNYTNTTTTPNVAFWKGNTGTSVTVCPAPNPDKNMGILIAWSGLTSGTSTVVINMTKVSELELAPRGYAVEQDIAPPHGATREPLISQIVGKLDENVPGWRAHAVRMATSAASSVTSAVLAGTSYLGGHGSGMAMILDGTP